LPCESAATTRPEVSQTVLIPPWKRSPISAADACGSSTSKACPGGFTMASPDRAAGGGARAAATSGAARRDSTGLVHLAADAEGGEAGAGAGGGVGGERVGAEAADLQLQRDGTGDSFEGEVAVDDVVVAVTADAGGAVRHGGVLVDLEEVRRADVVVALLVV